MKHTRLAALAATGTLGLGLAFAGSAAADYPYAVDQNGTAVPCGFATHQGADGRWDTTVGNCHDYLIQRKITFYVGSPSNCLSLLAGRGYTGPRTQGQPSGIASC